MWREVTNASVPMTATAPTKETILVVDDEGSAEVYTLSKPVPSLAHQCRNKIRAVAMDR